MDYSQAIDQLVAYVDNQPGVDGNSSLRRVRHGYNLLTVFAWVYLSRDWWFRKAAPTLTVPANDGDAPMPSSFMEFGYKGGVYLNTTGHRLKYVSPQEMSDIRSGPSAPTTDMPPVYTIDFQDPTSKLPLFRIPLNLSDLTFTLWSEKDVPTLDESTNKDNLKVIPERWHQLVLIPGARAMAQYDKADPRSQSFQADPTFAAGYRLMCITELRGKETPKQFPSFFGGDR